MMSQNLFSSLNKVSDGDVVVVALDNHSYICRAGLVGGCAASCLTINFWSSMLAAHQHQHTVVGMPQSSICC